MVFLCLRHWLKMSQRFLRMTIQIDKNRYSRRKGPASRKCDRCVLTTTAESNKGINFSSPALRIPSQ